MITVRFIRIVVLLLAVSLSTLASPLHAEPLKMAHGWSVNPQGGKVAADEAIAMMLKRVTEPRFIVL